MTFLLLCIQASLASILIIGLFRLRVVLGLAPFYLVLGGLQFLHVVLLASVWVELGVLMFSPGAAVLLTTWVYAVLLVEIREDAEEARAAMAGLLIANGSLVVLGALFSLHAKLPEASAPIALSDLLPAEWIAHVLSPDLRVVIASLVALALDVLLLMVLFDRVCRIVGNLFLRMLITGVAVVSLDAVLFHLVAYYPNPGLGRALVSALIARLVAVVVFSYVFAVYLNVFARRLDDDDTHDGRSFQRLSYRQRFELAQHQLVRDPLTGVFNRRFFDDELKRRLVAARSAQGSVSLIVLDLDHFKEINDVFGHQEGDRVLRQIGIMLRSVLRTGDTPCRIGGEEFAVLSDDLSEDEAAELAQRLRIAVHEVAQQHDLAGGQITATIGVAIYPLEAADASGLFRLADRRLYAGKAAGRDCTITEGIGITNELSRERIDAMLKQRQAELQKARSNGAGVKKELSVSDLETVDAD